MFESDRWQGQISETAHFGLNAIRQVAKIRLESLQEWDRRSWSAGSSRGLDVVASCQRLMSPFIEPTLMLLRHQGSEVVAMAPRNQSSAPSH